MTQDFLLDRRVALRAGYSKKTAHSIGSENLKKPEIQEALQAAINERAERTQVTANRVLYELARIAFANMGEYITVQGDGSAYVDLSRLYADQGAAIQEIISDIYMEGHGEDAVPVKRVKLKLHHRSKALELLGKHVGLGFAQRVEHSGPEGGTIETKQTIDVSKLSTETLRKVLEEARDLESDD